MLWNAILLALRAIRRNLLRSFLTTLGVVIGVAAVIVMVTLGNGATQAISSQIASLGSNLVIVRPGQRLGPGRDAAGAPRFHLADVQAIRSQINGLRAVAPTATKGVTLVYQAANWSTTVTGTSNAFFETGNWLLASGRLFNETDERAGKAVCVIGETVHRELFGQQDPLGAEVRVKKFTCQVIGLLVAKGQGAMGIDQDDIVVMPLRTVQRRLTGNQEVNALHIAIKEAGTIAVVKKALVELLRERRHITDNEEDDFSVVDTRQIADTLSGTTRVLTGLLGAVAGVSLLVGGIGIMNIMLVSVTERTREIGIRLAIGALEGEVLLQFLVESVVLAALGGVIGIILAATLSMALAMAMDVPFLFDPAVALLSFLFSVTIGVVFGYFPARRAARLDPIDALRHE